MSVILAIDPGSEQSALVFYRYGERPEVTHLGLYQNDHVIQVMRRDYGGYHMAIEMPKAQGMPASTQLFETCVWIGRFIQIWLPHPWSFIYRPDVKLHLCGSMRAKDSNIRAALIDRFGGSKRKAVGIKADRGPLFGIKRDIWQALAVAVYWSDTHAARKATP